MSGIGVPLSRRARAKQHVVFVDDLGPSAVVAAGSCGLLAFGGFSRM
jgi:hypothetical protein